MAPSLQRKFLAPFGFFLLLAMATAWFLTPSYQEVLKLAVGSDRILLSADGQLLQSLRTDFRKRRLAWYPLKSFPPAMTQAVILVEDRRFQQHWGFDPIGLARALWADLHGRPVQGASTLTMQLSDLIQEDVLVGNRSIKKGSLTHKLAQLSRALLLEIKWSKSEILEAYLNLIHLRGEFQGVPAVSYAYLNKHPLALDANEALVIAAMIASPNQGAPALKQRACGLLHQRVSSSSESCEGVFATVDLFFSRSPTLPASPGIAPHLARRLFKQFPNESVLTSTIDADLQQKVLAIMEKNIFRLREDNVHDNAAIVIDNKTGHVLAYVGTVSSSQSPHVDGVQAYRQAGSSLKPFLYAKAIENKTLTAASILLDDPTAISWGEGEIYRPSNYDRHFYGPVSVREALGSSLNVPAVKTVTILGLHPTYQVLQSLFSNLKEPDFYGVSMALGAVEVRLDELANAYRLFANGGLWTPLRFTAVPAVSVAGQAADRNHNEQKYIYSPAAAFIISSILSDPDARAIGFGWENPLETAFWSAVKTGTSKDYRDNWCVGFNARYTVGVWAGNFNAEAMQKVSGVSGAGPTWFEIMTYLQGHERSQAPLMPADVVAKKIRHQWVSHERQEYFIKGTEPTHSVIEPALTKKVQFVFPAEGSVLIKDPHMDQKNIALYVRFKGEVPLESQLFWDESLLGLAQSPFRIDKPAVGSHSLSLRNREGKTLGQVHFTVRGAE